jgi:hypothetical protein
LVGLAQYGMTRLQRLEPSLGHDLTDRSTRLERSMRTSKNGGIDREKRCTRGRTNILRIFAGFWAKGFERAIFLDDNASHAAARLGTNGAIPVAALRSGFNIRWLGRLARTLSSSRSEM